MSEREKFAIESRYDDIVTGNMEKARRDYEMWAPAYSRDWEPRNDLGTIYPELAQYDKSLAEFREAHRLDPVNTLIYGNLAGAYLHLNRFDEGRATAQEALARGFDSPDLRYCVYQLAFLRNDAAEMAQQVAWASGKAGMEDALLYGEADRAAYFGRILEARELCERAVAPAMHADEKEVAASYETTAALREAVVGNPKEVRKQVAAGLALSAGRDVQSAAGLALAMAGDSAPAQRLADDLAKRFPEDTMVQLNYLPAIRAQLALNRHDASKAIDTLKVTALYELGISGYNSITIPLYFFALWKDADPDIPILKEAKAEYAKLK